MLEMSETGLNDVADPSRTFLSERADGAVGSVIVPTLEGTRPLMVEVQALTSPSLLPAPRRVASGIDFNRLLLVCAVLTRRAGVSLANEDVIVNVTGGLRIDEPAADLGVAAGDRVERPQRSRGGRPCRRRRGRPQRRGEAGSAARQAGRRGGAGSASNAVSRRPEAARRAAPGRKLRWSRPSAKQSPPHSPTAHARNEPAGLLARSAETRRGGC